MSEVQEETVMLCRLVCRLSIQTRLQLLEALKHNSGGGDGQI